ncbi:MAG: hypothetical protein QGH42_10710 [Kiritimatiellia bacterium]|nr:hypothetical protein [Pseudomonadales bacterium]MDP6828988.1 hypothetical protein [Pseudomonadales bacterium]MDP7024694.1 hypothetical protein [Kiritimatiellia bacterium]
MGGDPVDDGGIGYVGDDQEGASAQRTTRWPSAAGTTVPLTTDHTAALGSRGGVYIFYPWRGDAGVRQVPGDQKIAYTYVYGAPGISAVTVLGR